MRLLSGLFLGDSKEQALQEQLKASGWPHLSPEDPGWDWEQATKGEQV